MPRFSALLVPGAGTVLFSEWRTGTIARARAAADALLAEWRASPPVPARLAQDVFLADDGSGLLFLAQWTSDEAHLAWARAHRATTVSRVDTRVPGIERPGLNRTRPPRATVYDAERPAEVFALAVGPAETTGRPAPAPGLLGAHVHLTRDGARAFVVTEWADAASHAASHAASGGAAGRRFTPYGSHR
ncbi:antibiotic biosynthesis monooxygenase [Streptomyces sp. P6-2-1]|uniref:antibiotic biosynthesis monooxygenase n=1 Tax=unclassified Streptomyces TaxID=2593676 RepID=UPI003D35F8E0